MALPTNDVAAPAATATAAAPPPLPPLPPATAAAPPPPPATAAAPPPPPATAAAPPPPPATAAAPPPPPATAAAPPPPQDLVPAPGASVPATQPIAGQGLAKALEKAQELGFEGLDLTGFGAFPIVRLHRGTYSTKDGMVLGTEFYGFIQDGGTKQKFVYNNGLPDNDPNRDFFYTYDQITTVKGQEVSGILDTWRQRGWAPAISPYLDTMVKLHGGEHDGIVVILSVPKTSISRISIHIANLINAGISVSQAVTRFAICPEVGSGATAFTPMDFTHYTG